MNKLVIGLVGKQGSGKGTFIELLKNELGPQNIDHIKSGTGGVLEAFVRIAEIPVTRENLQKMAVGLREYFGDDFISEAVGAKIRKSRNSIAIFDAVRWRCDERVVKGFRRNVIVFMDANKELRFKRLKNRLRGDEKELTWEQFEKAEVASTEIEIDDIGLRADFHVINDDSLDSLRLEVKFFCKKYQLLNGRFVS